jgi:phage shock protein E
VPKNSLYQDDKMRKLLLGLALAMALPAFAAEHWIDVRVPQQYQKEHVDGAVNIPLADLKTRIAAEVPDKNDTIHVYCNVGRQSGQAQQMLSEMGYTQVVNAGGLSQIARPKSASK